MNVAFERETKTVAWLSLGSNIGNGTANLALARNMLNENHLVIINQSSLYKTKPYGVLNQPDFVNQVIAVKTAGSPSKLLSIIRSIEAQMGRNRKKENRWGPRVIDIDILFYGDEAEMIYRSQELSVPHYDLHNRAFVLVPLAEISADIKHPQFGCTVAELLNKLNKEEVENCIVI